MSKKTSKIFQTEFLQKLKLQKLITCLLIVLGSYVQCPLGTPPIFDSSDNSQCAITDSSSGEGCESNEAICINFNTIALCCNRTVHFGFQDDASATCPSGKARWQIDGNTVLAKSCDAVVCPSGYSCKDGNFFSYCCEN